MRQSISHHYDQLTDVERYFVDTIFDRELFTAAEIMGVPLKGDDTIARAVDALARAVIESRVKA